MAVEASVSGRIVSALAEHLKRDAGSIKQTDRLRDDLGLDSMATIELLYRIEEAFDLQIPDQDLPGLSTVGDVTRYVQQRVAPEASSPPARTKTSGRTSTPKGRSSRS